RGQPECPAVDESPPAVVVDEQFADRLLGSVGRLWCQPGVVGDDLWQVTAVDGNGTGKDHARARPAAAADIEQQARTVEVDAHAEFEVGLRAAADDSSQVKDSHGIGIDRRFDDGRAGEVAGDDPYARVVDRRN